MARASALQAEDAGSIPAVGSTTTASNIAPVTQSGQSGGFLIRRSGVRLPSGAPTRKAKCSQRVPLLKNGEFCPLREPFQRIFQRPRSSVAERLHGKKEVTGSIPVWGSQSITGDDEAIRCSQYAVMMAASRP